ncbi:hypothetical protein YC2023_120552 [Brassica napus]
MMRACLVYGVAASPWRRLFLSRLKGVTKEKLLQSIKVFVVKQSHDAIPIPRELLALEVRHDRFPNVLCVVAFKEKVIASFSW